jgi:shikimate kinase
MNQQQLQGINIYLIGIMGSGKSTVGKLLADKLGYRFFDTDTLIERVAQKSLPDIFATEGEASFRQLESQVLMELSSYTKSAIATGGGIIQEQMNWSYLRYGLIIWLDVDLETLNQRLAGDNTRPLASKLESLLETRRPLYAQADLHITIKPEQTPEAIVTEIIEQIPRVLKPKSVMSNNSLSDN